MGQGFSAIVRDGQVVPHGEAPHGAPPQPYLQPVNYLLVGAALLICGILVGSERELKNTVLILSEQLDRSFQAIELVQRSVIDRIGGVRSSADFTVRLDGDDVHAMLQDKVSGLAQVDAIGLVNADGILINASRDKHPPHGVSVADRDYFRTLKSNPQLDYVVSVPESNRANGAWTIYLARRITTADGRFAGIIIGAVQLDYFEKLFGAIALGSTGT